MCVHVCITCECVCARVHVRVCAHVGGLTACMSVHMCTVPEDVRSIRSLEGELQTPWGARN